MKPTYFLIDLAQKFNPADEDFAVLKADSDKWEGKLKSDAKEDPTKLNYLQSLYVKYGDNWFVRTLTGIFFIIAERGVMDYLNPVVRGNRKFFDGDADSDDMEEQFEAFLEWKERAKSLRR